jgi:DNA-binding transcriptional regulator YdaS (Cro superfamily)
MEKTVDFQKAVAAFGGYSGLARRLNVALSTCHGWARRDRLPAWRAREIAALAKKTKKDVFKDEVAPKPKHKRRPRLKAA